MRKPISVVIVAVATTCLVLATTGCSGDSDDEAADTSTSTTETTTPPTSAVFDPGPSSTTSPSGDPASYTGELDALCTDLAAQFDDLASSVNPGPAAPETPEEFAAVVATIDATLDAIDAFTTGLQSVDAPPSAQAPIDSFASEMDQIATALLPLRAAAAAEDSAAMDAAFGDLDALDSAPIDAAAQALADLGATQCGPDA